MSPLPSLASEAALIVNEWRCKTIPETGYVWFITPPRPVAALHPTEADRRSRVFQPHRSAQRTGKWQRGNFGRGGSFGASAQSGWLYNVCSILFP